MRFCARELFAAGTQYPSRYHVRGQGATLARETVGSDKTSLSNMFHTFLATDAHDLLACPQSFQPAASVIVLVHSTSACTLLRSVDSVGWRRSPYRT